MSVCEEIFVLAIVIVGKRKLHVAMVLSKRT
jgi:hypothetical protein